MGLWQRVVWGVKYDYPFCLQERFTQDTQPHYIYSPREMTRWVRGIFEALRPLETLPVEGLIRIWAHEALRLFQDRYGSPGRRMSFAVLEAGRPRCEPPRGGGSLLCSTSSGQPGLGVVSLASQLFLILDPGSLCLRPVVRPPLWA